MVISLLGSSGVKCQVADFSLVIDPPAKKRGNLTLLTQIDFTQGDIIPEEAVINGPGEYEIEGIKIRGVGLSKEGAKNEGKTAYSVLFDGIRLGALCALSNKMDDVEVDALGEVDILFMDIEGSTLGIKDIASLVKKIDPSIVIPMSEKGAKRLLEELGQKVSAQEKFAIKAKDFNKETSGIQVIWLKE
ncbi:MAG: MBL fold metallo-hydrolase [Candidatus Colwellbacteria bacterium]|nr:MBL fold metallo-hydrolase [Candidatus Colwellbacteria bacterium]